MKGTKQIVVKEETWKGLMDIKNCMNLKNLDFTIKELIKYYKGNKENGGHAE